MSASFIQPDTLLDHPALAGHTVFVRRGGDWQRFVVRQAGGLVPDHSPTARFASFGWRTPAWS